MFRTLLAAWLRDWVLGGGGRAEQTRNAFVFPLDPRLLQTNGFVKFQSQKYGSDYFEAYRRNWRDQDADANTVQSSSLTSMEEFLNSDVSSSIEHLHATFEKHLEIAEQYRLNGHESPDATGMCDYILPGTGDSVPGYFGSGAMMLDIARDLKTSKKTLKTSRMPQKSPTTFLNIGGGETIEGDPLSRLILANGTEHPTTRGVGVIYEPDPNSLIKEQVDHERIKLVAEPLIPRKAGDAVEQLFRKIDSYSSNSSKESDYDRFDFLKIDVGSFDCDLLKAIMIDLGRKQLPFPKVIVMQSNILPPPFKYSQRYEPGDVWEVYMRHGYNAFEEHVVYACSLSYQVDYLINLLPQKYELVSMVGADTVFVRNDVVAEMMDVLADGSYPLQYNPRTLGESALLFPGFSKRVGSIDEFDCYRRQFVQEQLVNHKPVQKPTRLASVSYLQEWFFSNDLEVSFLRMWKNLTEARQGLREDARNQATPKVVRPFVLDTAEP